MLRVLVADNDPEFLKSLRLGLERDGALVEICESCSREEALKLLEENVYDAFTLNIDMRGLNCFDTLNTVKTLHPDLPVLILGFRAEEDKTVSRALAAGADGYLCKWKSLTDFVPALERIVPLFPRKSLSSREYEVARRLLRGKSETKIAMELGLSVKTIGTYKQRIFEKMGFKNNADMFQKLPKKIRGD